MKKKELFSKKNRINRSYAIKEVPWKKILITGGTTFVSKYAAEYFVNAGYEVYVLNRNTKPQVQVPCIRSSRQSKIYPEIISLEEGIKDAAE